MKKVFTPILLAATIALTSLAPRPVQAASNDFSSFMLGLTTLFILGAALDQDKKPATISRNRNNKKSNNNRRYRPPSYDNGRYRNPGYDNRRYRKPGHDNRRHSGKWKKAPDNRFKARRSLPSECLRRVNTGNGYRNVFGKRCLRKQYGSVQKLPAYCERTIGTQNGRRKVYGARCLRTYGFGVASYR